MCIVCRSACSLSESAFPLWVRPGCWCSSGGGHPRSRSVAPAGRGRRRAVDGGIVPSTQSVEPWHSIREVASRWGGDLGGRAVISTISSTSAWCFTSRVKKCVLSHMPFGVWAVCYRTTLSGKWGWSWDSRIVPTKCQKRRRWFRATAFRYQLNKFHGKFHYFETNCIIKCFLHFTVDYCSNITTFLFLFWF